MNTCSSTRKFKFKFKFLLEDQALEVKQTAKTIFSEATFQLHKWHSNVQALEAETVTSDEDGQSYAKQQLGVKKGKSKLPRVPWDKKRDEIQVSFPISMAVSTKRGMREKLPKFTTRSDRSQGPNLAREGIVERAVHTSTHWSCHATKKTHKLQYSLTHKPPYSGQGEIPLLQQVIVSRT